LTDLAAYHDELRPLMFSVAYGMFGIVSEAEDITQEALLRMYRETDAVHNPSAFAVTVTTRLAIDQLRSARARREVYVGAWLPEPLVAADPAEGPAEQVEAAERLSFAFLVMLERLSPVERAVLLLREVFDYDYDRIADIVGRSEANCRQILVRAKAHVRERPRFDVSRAQRDALATRFFLASSTGDLAAPEQLLAEDIEVTGDGGGKVPAVSTPVAGRRRVARSSSACSVRRPRRGCDSSRSGSTAHPAVGRSPADGQTVAVFAMDIVDDRIVALHNVLNPDKLRHLAAG
jgi:RNA polymerase sigma factor (sigma-70 family)